jgi:Domain of unknown function (DUF303).
MCNTTLKLSPILSDGVILQRDKINYIYGTDMNATIVTASFKGNEYRAEVDENDTFQIALPPIEAGGPYELTVKGSNEITIKDILFGDVYILSGQSNMELQLRGVLDVSEEEIDNSCESFIRQYYIPATYNFKEPEKYMYASSWKKAMGEDLLDFSAAGFFFAKDLHTQLKIPIGLVMTAVPGSGIEAWMNPTTLSAFGDYNSKIEKFKDINYFNSYIKEQQDAADEWYSQLEVDENKLTASEDITKWDICRVPSLVSDYPTGEFQGSVYLCKEIYLEEDPVTNDAYIYMGSIIDSDILWINEELIGRTEYRYPPRKYKINPGILKQGKNLITIRIVVNNKNGGTVKGMPYHLHYNGHNIGLEGEWYYKIGKKAAVPMPEVLFPPHLPVSFYHTAIFPISKIASKGVLWYQGETNTNAPDNYANLFAAMVSDWRVLFGWNIPFIYVQLTNYRDALNTVEDTGWAGIREQQRRCLNIDNVAMITTLDIGDPNDLHPQNKKAVGVRLARAARALIYNENSTYSGPLPVGATIEENVAKIEFIYLQDKIADKKLSHFELAGEDGVYYKANAVQMGKYVSLSCDRVVQPKFARYAWSDCPENIDFYNESGYPAAGFQIEL